MEFNYLKNLISELIKRFQYRNLQNEFNLKQQLHYLNENERKLVRKLIKSEPYNIGTFSVIKLLKSENILGICDYLEGVSEEYEVLQIITDLLDDSARSIDLLKEVLINSNFQNILDEALSNYFEDLIKHPELIKTELILSTYKSLPNNIFHNAILSKLINHLLYHQDEHILESPEVVSHQMEWSDQFKDFGLLSKVFMNIMPFHSEFIVNKIMPVVGEKTNWFYLLLILNHLKEDHSGYSEMKQFIKANFNNFKSTNDLKCLYKSIILARQLYHYSSRESTYKAWVKTNFGDLKYSLKEAKSFQSLLLSLQSLVVYENDPEILNIHISCQISAPSKMYSSVLEYKEVLKSKEEILLNKMEEM